MYRTAGLLLALATTGCVTAQDFVLDPPAPDIIAADADDLYNSTTIVALATDAAAADRLAAAATGYDLLSRHTLGAIGEEMLVFRIPGGTTGVQAIAELEGLEPGVTAGVNHAYRADPSAGLPQGREYANALLGWPGAGCRALVPIGIIDTDLAMNTPALAGVSIVRKSFVSGRTAPDHGTAVAQLIAGPGRLNDARIFHASVVGAAEGGTEAAGVDSLVRALDWLQASGVRLVNVSLAGPYNKILDRGLQAAAKRGMVIVAAAGNTGRHGPPRYPAAFRQTIAVTAVDADLRPYQQSPEARYLDIAAPGVDVFVPQGEGRYISGTSVAAPFVTAVIAADPSASRLGSAEALRAWLRSGARDLGAPGEDNVFGAGLVQAGTACHSES